MKYYFLFAWRNLWRNKRRTLLATSSVFFAMLLALIFRSLQSGQHDYMIQMSVSMYTGYLQIQGRGFWEERSFDESIAMTDSLIGSVRSDRRITTVNPRLESVALVSRGTETRITPVTGIDPEAENAMSGLRNKIVKGTYLNDTSAGVLIAEGLAERLQADIGDSIVIVGQGYQGVTAAEQLPVEGIVRFPFPKLNNAAIYLSLSAAQKLFNAPDRVTGIALMIDDEKEIDDIRTTLAASIDSSLVVMTWEEMSPEIVQVIEADVASEAIIMAILYIVIGFGVFGTVMMMTIERTREFGLLVALGMKRGRLLIVTTVEALMVSMLGAAAGLAAAFPLLFYFHLNPIRVTGEMAEVYITYGLEPIIAVSVDAMVFGSQAIAVLVLAVAASLYPLLYIRKLRPVSALQGRGGNA
jgi:ABC-type lipoprotein release transport system permease subunit